MRTHLSARSCFLRNDRGVALIITLLLLSLLVVLGLAVTVSVSSDSLINGFYRNYRGSFYGADSGLNVARQDMVNQLLAAVPAKFSATAQPIPAGTEAAILQKIAGTYAQFQSLNAGKAASSWKASYQIINPSLSLANCTVHYTGSPTNAGPYTCTNLPSGLGVAVTNYQYIYNYSLTANGQSAGTERGTISDSGSFIINANIVPAGGATTSFAAWGMFIDQYSICSGSYLVPGTISGPVFTNGAWTFGSTGAYIFTDKVGSVSANAGFQFSSTCDQKAASSDKKGSQTISPTFQNGFNLGQPNVPLPANSYNQERAVLDGVGTSGNPVTKSDLNKSVRGINTAAYPNSGASSGVFLPFQQKTDSNGNNYWAMTGGGIYVEGSANLTLSTSGTSTQIFTVTQGSTITTVTVNMAANTTTFTQGSTTVNITGVPMQYDLSSGLPLRDATMVFVDGSINALSGPGQGVPAIQDGSAVTITAASNITVTGDLLYKTEPVTTTQNQIVPGSNPPCCSGTPADTLIPGNNNGQALGIFTAAGNIQLANTQSNKNLEIDASIAALSQGGSGGLVNTGSAINTLTIVGGRIQNTIQNINSTTRNVFFDRRYAQGGFSPPWFPSTTLSGSTIDSATLTATVQRLQWVDTSNYF